MVGAGDSLFQFLLGDLEVRISTVMELERRRLVANALDEGRRWIRGVAVCGQARRGVVPKGYDLVSGEGGRVGRDVIG